MDKKETMDIKEILIGLAKNKWVRYALLPAVVATMLIAGTLYAKSGNNTADSNKANTKATKERAALEKDEQESAESASEYQQPDGAGSVDQQQENSGTSSTRGSAGSQSSGSQSSQSAKSQNNQSGSSSGQSTSPSSNQPQKQVIHVTLSIDKGSGKRNYSLEMDKNSTVLQLLQKGSSTHGFSLYYTNNGAYGAFIEEIDGVRNSPTQGLYWLYYLNGKYANVGASVQKINEGDTVLWKYQSAN